MKALLRKAMLFCLTKLKELQLEVKDIIEELSEEELSKASRLGWDGICPGCNKWLHNSYQGKCIEVTDTSYLYACDGCKTLSAWDVVSTPCPIPDKGFKFDKSEIAKDYLETGYVIGSYEKNPTV